MSMMGPNIENWDIEDIKMTNMNRAEKRAQGATRIPEKNGLELAAAVHEARRIGVSFVEINQMGMMRHFKSEWFDEMVEIEVKKRLEIKRRQVWWKRMLSHPACAKVSNNNFSRFILSTFNKFRKLSA